MTYYHFAFHKLTPADTFGVKSLQNNIIYKKKIIKIIKLNKIILLFLRSLV